MNTRDEMVKQLSEEIIECIVYEKRFGTDSDVPELIQSYLVTGEKAYGVFLTYDELDLIAIEVRRQLEHI